MPEIHAPRFLRSEWGAAHGKGPEHHGNRDLLVIHHFWQPDVPCGASLGHEAEVMRGVERYHAEDNGWGRIGYHWVVFPSGHVYEGIGWARIGAHTAGQNTRSYGIALAFDGDVHVPTPAMVQAVRELVSEAMRGVLTPDFRLAGHREFSPKSCPGDRVFPVLSGFDPRDGEELPPRHPVLRMGDTGPAVERLQRLLGIDPDGDFGPRTRTTVQQFQIDAGLSVDGIVGPETWGRLEN